MYECGELNCSWGEIWLKRKDTERTTYWVSPLSAESLPKEVEEARKFWQNYPLEPHYVGYHELCGVLLSKLGELSFRSVLEFGCNAGRNLHYIRKTFPHTTIRGIDLNEKAVLRGRAEFDFSEDELTIGDEHSLESIPSESYDVVFTMSVLDHLPDPGRALSNLIRIARLHILLIEFALDEFGKIEGKIVSYSYSHNYMRILRGYSGLISDVRMERIVASDPFKDYYVLITANRHSQIERSTDQH